jgi:hypothetical protein
MGIAEVVKRYLRYFLPKMEKADGMKHPITCRSIPDQDGITKCSARCFCSKMSRTRSQVFYSKMSKTASHFWEVNLIRAYRVNKNEVAKLDPMQ